MKDPDYLIKVEKAIKEKYGDEAIQNPKANWDEEKKRIILSKSRNLIKCGKKKRKLKSMAF